MSLLPPPTMVPLSPLPKNPSEWSSTAICQKLLYVCYYYSRCFGMAAYAIRRSKEINSKGINTLREPTNISRTNNEFQTHHNSTAHPQLSQRPKFVLQAYVVKSLLWFHTVIRIIFCTCYTYAAFSLLLVESYIFSFIIYSQVLTIAVCPTLMAIIQIWHRGRLMRALNSLFRLLRAIKELHCGYEIFQWTHVIFVTIKVVTFMYEIIVCVQSVVLSESWFQFGLGLMQNILLIEIWLNLHAATLLYICVDAMYGSLNHYMKHTFILPLRVMQQFGPIISSTHVNRLMADLARFIRLFKKVQRVGLELNCVWQLPIACTLVSIYFGTISVIYYIIWQYFAANIIYMRFVPLTLKLVFDITLLSLTAHRAIKSSQLIGCMGLENVVLAENEDWHRQMEQFLCHIKLYQFKLNCLGLFDITNDLSLTFISGILTFISIIIPFFIEAYRIQKLLEKQN